MSFNAILLYVIHDPKQISFEVKFLPGVCGLVGAYELAHWVRKEDVPGSKYRINMVDEGHIL